MDILIKLLHDFTAEIRSIRTKLGWEKVLMFALWIVTFLAEGLLYTSPKIWLVRKKFAILLGLSVILGTLGLSSSVGPFTGSVLMLLGAYRLINILRVIKNRLNETYLRQAVRRTAVWLLLIHAAILMGISVPLALAPQLFMKNIAILQLTIAALFALFTYKNIIKLRFKMPTTYLTDRELPTVTVALPARNETVDLDECLQAILASDYPKLEVLVLDDCSQARTAEVIRSFAHRGVRFIKGLEPADRWLAKNQAYHKLYLEASGNLILFCGVDVRLGPQSIRSMVNLMASRKKSMLSVVPLRTYSFARAAFIQPMRYWWELALPRRAFNKPPVLSTCWIIGRKNLKALGGFAAVSQNIIPERYFARELVKTDQYSFVRSNAELQVNTVKSYTEQQATAIRTQYPLLRKRPELALLLTIFYILFFLLPFGLLAISPWWQPVHVIMLALSCVMLTASHLMIVNITDPSNNLLAVATFPVAVVVEIYLLHVSMLQYEFFSVTWKERNICIPVMRVYTHLPPMPDK